MNKKKEWKSAAEKEAYMKKCDRAMYLERVVEDSLKKTRTFFKIMILAIFVGIISGVFFYNYSILKIVLIIGVPIGFILYKVWQKAGNELDEIKQYVREDMERRGVFDKKSKSTTVREQKEVASTMCPECKRRFSFLKAKMKNAKTYDEETDLLDEFFSFENALLNKGHYDCAQVLRAFIDQYRPK